MSWEIIYCMVGNLCGVQNFVDFVGLLIHKTLLIFKPGVLCPQAGATLVC